MSRPILVVAALAGWSTHAGGTRPEEPDPALTASREIVSSYRAVFGKLGTEPPGRKN